MTRADSGAQSRGVCLGLKRGQGSRGLHDAKGQFWGLGCPLPTPAFADPKPRPGLSYLVGGCQVWHMLRVPKLLPDSSSFPTRLRQASDTARASSAGQRPLESWGP